MNPLTADETFKRSMVERVRRKRVYLTITLYDPVTVGQDPSAGARVVNFIP